MTYQPPRFCRLLSRLAWVPAVLLLANCTGVRDTSRTFRTVVIDAGHGGHDSGARSRSRIQEKTLALDTALRLEKKMRAAGFRTVMTRESDVFIPLDRRVAIGNRQTNSIFVSVHFNHSRRRAVRGIETYYKSPTARTMASRLARNMADGVGAPNRGTRTANFRVLRKARFPSVLLECGYLSNGSEARRCASEEYRERLAASIAETLIEQRGR